mmetsp:Transcript_23104/g.36092  ORF Transcript_23104/g.36092 Transcript_23104/m.36092 type:complete len:83 (+) Transcript_23104:104-352(+)
MDQCSQSTRLQIAKFLSALVNCIRVRWLFYMTSSIEEVRSPFSAQKQNRISSISLVSMVYESKKVPSLEQYTTKGSPTRNMH